MVLLGSKGDSFFRGINLFRGATNCTWFRRFRQAREHVRKDEGLAAPLVAELKFAASALHPSLANDLAKTLGVSFHDPGRLSQL